MTQFEKLTPEQSERLMDCKTPEDILAFAQSEGYELTDEELSEISGGGWGDSIKDFVKEKLQCPYCGSYEVHRFPQPGVPGAINCRCMGCGAAFVTIGGVLHT